MTSLQGSLPDTASGLWRMDREYGVSNTRVKHIVIHEAHIRESPDRHVVYRIDVFTQERNWCVYRRYSEFRKLHDKISETFKMFKGSFPPKQLSGNLSPAIIEQRRSSLEHYLLKIVNCHNQDVSSCPTVLRFLDLHHNDVYHVTSALCRYVRTFGEAILNEGHYFVLSPTQLFCVHKRLRIPNSDADYKADTVFCDLGSLYDFLGRLNKVCIKPASLQDQGIRCEIALLKNVKELQIQTFSVSLIKGLASLQLQIQRLKATQALTAMKDLLIDCVLERKTQPKQPGSREGGEPSSKMRNSYNSKMMFNSYTIHPWISLLYLDLSHNSIRQLDDSFSLLPNLQELDLSFNQIEVLDLNFINPALTKLTCTHCCVMKVITKTHENLVELSLSHNKLTELTGFNKIVMLKKLDLYSNCVTTVDNIACLTELPRLQDISIAENPLSKSRSYRNKVLCMFTQACRRTDIIVDGKGFSEKEKKRAKNTRVKGTTRQGPSSLPFFGSTSDQVPTAFAQQPQQDENHWNSILHDSSVTTESSHSDSEEAELGSEEEALSPVLSEIRSTPSQTRTYDWDPAQAFASSASPTPPPGPLPYHASPGGALVGFSGSQQGSSTCLDNTSSCDDGELYQSVTMNEYNPLEPASPTEEPVIKNFNSNYYNLSGTADLYSSSPGQDTSSKLRVNPFGQPCDGVPQGSNIGSSSKVPQGSIIGSSSGSSKDLSDTSSEEDYTSCREESRLEESVRDDTVVEDKSEGRASARSEGGVSAAGGNLFEGMDIVPPSLCLDLSEREIESVSEYNTPAPSDISPQPDSAFLGEEPGSLDKVTESVKEMEVSNKNNPSTRDDGSVGVETFVVDRPDYDDIIFAGGTSPEQYPGSSAQQNNNQTTSHTSSGKSDNISKTFDTETVKTDASSGETPNFISNSPMLVGNSSPLILDDSLVLVRERSVINANKDTQVEGQSVSNRDNPVSTEDIPVSLENSPLRSGDSPSSAQEDPVLASGSPVLPAHSSVMTRDNPGVAQDSPARDSPMSPARDSPMSPVSDGAVATDSPVSPGLTDQTSSGDECIARLNKIQSLSFSKDTEVGDLYDSEDSEDISDGISFSDSKLQF